MIFIGCDPLKSIGYKKSGKCDLHPPLFFVCRFDIMMLDIISPII